MFNFRPDRARIGFAVEPDEPPGFRVGADALPLPALASQPGSPSLPGDPDAGAPLAVSDLLLQTGGPIEPNPMAGLPDRFVGNPYWPAERDHAMVSLIIPTGYGSPWPSAQLPRPEEMQTTPPWRSDSPVNAERHGAPDASVPSTGGLPSGIGSPQSPIMVQYKPEDAPSPLPASPPRTSPEVDTSLGEVVVLPDGSTIADTDPKSSPTGYVMSPKMDLHDVAAQGRQIGEAYRSMRANPATSGSALPYLYTALALNVGQGGTYDHQRRGNMITGYTQLRQFRPIANVNVGLLGQQAGLTLEETLDIAGTYARWRSSNADPNSPYGLDPRTLHYIKRGYEIGQTGMFDPPARR
jgi:hypothetical protein